MNLRLVLRIFFMLSENMVSLEVCRMKRKILRKLVLKKKRLWKKKMFRMNLWVEIMYWRIF